MTSIAIVLLQCLASIGFGHLVLRISGTVDEFNKGEQTAMSFAMGMGVLGWMIFFIGIGQIFSAGWLLAVLGAGAAAAIPLAFAVLSAKRSRFWKFSVIEMWIVAGIVIAAIFDLAEALAPAADHSHRQLHHRDRAPATRRDGRAEPQGPDALRQPQGGLLLPLLAGSHPHPVRRAGQRLRDRHDQQCPAPSCRDVPYLSAAKGLQDYPFLDGVCRVYL